MTQKEMVIQYINNFGSITPMQAYGDLGITKLATRISELKKEGWEFDIEMVKSKNRNKKATRYARYSAPRKREVVR